MSWRAFLTDRPQVPGLKPLSLSWDAIGGPQQAILSLDDEAIGFEAMQSWLGSGIEIYDPSDRLAWWGYVDQVSQPLEETEIKSSLEALANRVAVRYRSMEPGKDFGAVAQIEWKDDLTSQAIYGVKELLLKRGMMSQEQALQLRDMSLSQLANPVRKLQPSMQMKQSQLFCCGWFERLRWRQWPARSDVLGHSPNQQGTQSLGATLAQKSLAQSFAFPDALKVVSVSVRIRKIGNPLDQIRFQLQTDALGQPSGITRTEATLAASGISTESYAWVSVWFANPCTVAANERLWLVVSRDGAASSTAYFSFGLDENLGFAEGKLLLLDASLSQWKPRSPDADMLFKMTALSNSVDLMDQLVPMPGCFRGFSFEAGEGLDLPYVSSIGADCHSAFMDLLRMGTPGLTSLLVEVNSQHRLRVFPQPQPGLSRYWLGKDGHIKNEAGKDLEPAWQAVCNWLRSETSSPCFLENLHLDISEGKFQLQTETAANL